MRIKECAENFVSDALRTCRIFGLNRSGGGRMEFRRAVHYYNSIPAITPKAMFLVFNPEKADIVEVPKVFGNVRCSQIYEYWKHSFIKPFLFNYTPYDYKSFNAFINRISDWSTQTIACKGEWYIASPWLLLDKDFNILYYITESLTNNGTLVKRDVYVSNNMFSSEKVVETNFVKYIIPTFIECGVRVHIGIPQTLAFRAIPPELALSANVDINKSFNVALHSAARKFTQKDPNEHLYVKFSGTPTMDPSDPF